MKSMQLNCILLYSVPEEFIFCNLEFFRVLIPVMGFRSNFVHVNAWLNETFTTFTCEIIFNWSAVGVIWYSELVINKNNLLSAKLRIRYLLLSILVSSWFFDLCITGSKQQNFNKTYQTLRRKIYVLDLCYEKTLYKSVSQLSYQIWCDKPYLTLAIL